MLQNSFDFFASEYAYIKRLSNAISTLIALQIRKLYMPNMKDIGPLVSEEKRLEKLLKKTKKKMPGHVT